MIHSFEYCLEKINDTGEVVAVRDYIVQIEGLSGVRVNEGVAFETGQHGYVVRIEEKYVWVVVFSKEVLNSGTRVVRTGNKLKVTCGDGLLGHAISPLGYVIDGGKEQSIESESIEVDREPLGIERRVIITKPMLTGTTIVDLALPLGAGQRELVIGERKTGKTWFALQALATQVRQGKVGVYCAIGKQAGEILAVKQWLEKNKVMDGVIIVASGAKENQAEVVLTPLTAMSVAEYMRDRGRDVFVVLDDLTTHAKYYREISLVMGKFPGRDSYPGDIFYMQSKLLERAGCFEVEGKERSISCMPIAESVGGDMTGYIQTNLMSITDGHVYFDLEKFQHGARPAVNIFLSVTRVGRQTRNKLYHNISAEIYAILKKVESAKVFTKFGPEQTEEVKMTLVRGENMDKLLTRANGKILEEGEMLYLYAWYRKKELVKETPEELLEMMNNKGLAQKWGELLKRTDSVEELTAFVEKRDRYADS